MHHHSNHSASSYLIAQYCITLYHVMSFNAMSNLSQSLIFNYFISSHFISFYLILGLELLSKYEKENATHITGEGAGGGGFSSSRPVQGKVQSMIECMTYMTMYCTTCYALKSHPLWVDRIITCTADLYSN